MIVVMELHSGHFATRRYRNRRIGELLKELSLTESRGTDVQVSVLTIDTRGTGLGVFCGVAKSGAKDKISDT